VNPIRILDEIAKLWAQGIITEQIAERLGLTKGSVCRKARDARLRGDSRFPVRKRHVFMIKPLPPKPKENPRLIDLPPNGCKYPVRSDEADNSVHFFCAEPRKANSPYCPAHTAACSNKLHGVTTWVRR
jgi:hypothetical protein